MRQPQWTTRWETTTTRARAIVRGLSRLLSPVVDELIRFGLLWGLLVLVAVYGLEVCRWFWLVYPETMLGQHYLQRADAVPPFVTVLLQASRWSLAVSLVTLPCLAAIALAWASRFSYVQRVGYNPWGPVRRTLLWAALVAAWAGPMLATRYGFPWESGVVLVALPSVAVVPRAFHTAERLCPEGGTCLRWMFQGFRWLLQRCGIVMPATASHRQRKSA